jgi:hypothetical protein
VCQPGIRLLDGDLVTPATKQAHSNKVRTRFREKCAKRAEIAAAFRASLVAELRLNGSEPSASQAGLILACTSAFTEIEELNDRFIRGYATAKTRQQLGLARSEMRRCLQALRLIDRNGDENEPPKPNVKDLIARIEAKAVDA